MDLKLSTSTYLICFSNLVRCFQVAGQRKLDVIRVRNTCFRSFFLFVELCFVCIIVAKCDLVHDVEIVKREDC